MGQFGLENEITRKLWLENILSTIPRRKRLLDAGAGELANKRFCDHLEYISQDFCQYNGSGNEHALQTGQWDTSKIDLICDIVSIPEANESFDVILCSEVFEHIPSPEKALIEFQRLLRPGGILILTAPFCSLTHFAPFHFSSGYNIYFYNHYLKELGFKIDEISRNGNYFSYLAQESFRIEDMALKYSDYRITFVEKWIISKFLKLLKKASRTDKGSDELLCFGFHVVAKKL